MSRRRDGQTDGQRKDRATQLLICEKLSLAISCYHSTFNLCTTSMTSYVEPRTVLDSVKSSINISEPSPIYRNWLWIYLLKIYRQYIGTGCTRSAVKILTVFATNTDSIKQLNIVDQKKKKYDFRSFFSFARCSDDIWVRRGETEQVWSKADAPCVRAWDFRIGEDFKISEIWFFWHLSGPPKPPSVYSTSSDLITFLWLPISR